MYYSLGTTNEYPTLAALDAAKVEIFNDWWNTYIPEHKEELCKKIIHTYYFYQIGQETPARFVWNLNSTLERIMPYYNQLYKSELIKINPLLNQYLENHERTIENLLTKANTSNDKFAKAIRDFMGVTDESNIGSSTSETNSVGNKTESGSENTVRDGTSTEVGEEHRTGKANETTSGKMDSEGSAHTTEDETSSSHTTEHIDKVETENPGQVSTKQTQYGKTQTGKETMTGKDSSTDSGEKNWTETIDDDSTTDTTGHVDESGTTSNTQKYADTPQKQLNPERIRQDYLTNVTWNDGSSSAERDSTENVKFADDKTIDHKETTSGTGSVDKNSTTDTTMNLGGADTETTTMSGTNEKTTVTDTESTTTGSKNSTTDTTKEEHETTSGTKKSDDSDDITDERDKEWEDESTTTRNAKADTTSKDTTKAETSGTKSQQSRESNNMSSSESVTNVKTGEETTDRGVTTTMSGYTNISSSRLLQQFRETFLNVDQMIIDELLTCFLTVF